MTRKMADGHEKEPLCLVGCIRFYVVWRIKVYHIISLGSNVKAVLLIIL